jgi:hypothetical protein
VALYRGARRSLEGRAMFVNTDEASPAAAYLTLNDPIAQRGPHRRRREGRLHRPHPRRRRHLGRARQRRQRSAAPP